MAWRANKKQLKELIIKQVNEALKKQQKQHDAEMLDLEDRVRGECELSLQAKDAELELMAIKVKDAEEMKKDALDVYYMCHEMINKGYASACKHELYSEKMEKAIGSILQSVRQVSQEMEDNKKLLTDNDEKFRKKLKLIG